MEFPVKVLVANLGSTSFKFRLFDMNGEAEIARGGIERIGDQNSAFTLQIGERNHHGEQAICDHSEAVEFCLQALCDESAGCLSVRSELDAIGFKAVHGGRISAVQKITDDLLAAMSEMNAVAPAHNPPYIAAMKQLAKSFPDLPLVAAFETGFHSTIAEPNRYYAVPYEWSRDWQIKKWGFHGASHRYIAERMHEIDPSNKTIISCHLGGSSSLCAIKEGKSVAVTMGMSPQTGLPQSNRCGDFDPFAIALVMEHTGYSFERVLEILGNESGLKGISGVSGDIRDLESAAADGNGRAQLALDVFVAEIRRHLGGLMIQLGGLDAIVFTGGIGEKGANIRKLICDDLAAFGIEIDQTKNENVSSEEAKISAEKSPVQLWVVPTNEELMVARQTVRCLVNDAASV
jgi:acetate kinase